MGGGGGGGISQILNLVYSRNIKYFCRDFSNRTIFSQRIYYYFPILKVLPVQNIFLKNTLQMINI